MSETKWTPGPWTLHRGFSDWGLPCQHDVTVGEGVTERDQIAGIPSITPYCLGAKQSDRDYAARQYANACLIAAAPDLYAALENLLTIVEVGIDTGTFELAGSLTYAPGDARAALKKARGDQ